MTQHTGNKLLQVKVYHPTAGTTVTLYIVFIVRQVPFIRFSVRFVCFIKKMGFAESYTVLPFNEKNSTR